MGRRKVTHDPLLAGRYQALFMPSGYITGWARQYGYKVGIEHNPWSRKNQTGDEESLHQHLDWSRRRWIGWQCWRNPQGIAETDYLVIDVDAKTPEEADRARSFAERVLTLFGVVWFVCQSPSYGYHIYLRLSRRVALAELIIKEVLGPIADLLRDAGFQVGKEHKLEVFPQTGNCHRAPLGTDQPLVDPVTLENLGIGTLADALTYVESRLDQCLDVDDLLARCAQAQRNLPATAPEASVAPVFATPALVILEGGQMAQEHLTDVYASLISLWYDRDAAQRYWIEGLPDFGHRFAAQKLLVRGMLSDPADYAFATPPSDREIGLAFAQWLQHWGHRSHSWQRRPSLTYWTDDTAEWARRLRNPTDRLQRKLLTQLANAEADLIFVDSADGLSKRHVRAGDRERYAFALLNKAKWVCQVHGIAIGPRSTIHLSVKELLTKLPGASSATYADRLRWMEAAGLIWERGKSYSKRKKRPKTMTLDLDPVPGLSAGELQAAFQVCQQMAINEVAVVVHAIHAARRYTDAELAERYGGKLSADLVAAVRAAMAAARPTEAPSEVTPAELPAAA
jgi:hypothetical protein